LIQDGRFREHPWYRLPTFTIVLPPLRERGRDIAALPAHFARRFGPRLCRPTVEDLTRISRTPSAADAETHAVTGRTRSSRLDVPSTTPALLFTACGPSRRDFHALATKTCEKRGPGHRCTVSDGRGPSAGVEAS